MPLSVGIIGLPNVGKSTLFHALTKKQVNISNYPFCTIDPNVGVVAVPDDRLEKLADLLHPDKILPTTIEFFDIAGLVQGAHQGEGLGNQFLSHIREVDAVVHVVRAFHNPQIVHTTGSVDPKRDQEIIQKELIMADLQTLENSERKLQKSAQKQDPQARKMLPVVAKVKKALQQGYPAKQVVQNEEEQALLHPLHLLTLKPLLRVYNIDESEINKKIPDGICLCARLEAELADLPDDEVRQYLRELHIPSTGLQKLIKESYRLLNLITFFTIQNRILQAWSVKKGTLLPQAGGKIHSDFEKNFIKAEVISFKDLLECGGESNTREMGRLRIEGKNTAVQEGDIVRFYHHP